MAVLYTNNAFTLLAIGINSSVTSMTVTAGEGARFPSISGSDFFYLTITSATLTEIVKVTARSTDTFAIVRAQDGTTGQTFSTGDSVQLKINKAMLDGIKTDVLASAVAAGAAILADTTSAGYTITLPASPSTGNQVVIVDSTGTFGTNNLTVSRNGSTISGVADDLVLDISGIAVTLVYSGTTWVVYAQIGANTGTAVTLSGAQTLTNKTLTTPVISTISNTGTLTLPTSTDTLVGRATTDTLTNKTLTTPALTSPTVTDYVESVVAIGTVTTASTISLTGGTVQTATLTASTACVFTMPTVTAGKSFVLLLKQAAATGGGTATFTSVKWGTAGAPTITATAGKMDVLSFVADGVSWYGSITQGYTP